MKASNNRYKEALEAIQKRNKGKPLAEQEVPRIVAGKLIINGEVVPDPVYIPDVKTLMHLTQDEIAGFNNIEFDISNNYTLSKSTFHGYCTKIACYRDVNEAYKKLKFEERYTTHIMMGCHFQDGPTLRTFSCGDGEASRGIEIANLLKFTKSIGYVVFVIRFKLGGNMGPHRFGCIKAVAKQALEKSKAKAEILRQSGDVPVANPLGNNSPTPATPVTPSSTSTISSRGSTVITTTV